MPPLPPPPLHILPAPSGINHGAGLIALGDGRLLTCWYSGASEAGPEAVILCAHSADLGDHWDAPRPVSRPHERALTASRAAKSVGNVVLARDDSGRIVMIVGEIQSHRVLGVETCRTWRCGRIDFRISSDLGQSWSSATRLDDRPGALPRSRPVHVASGDLLPVYEERGRASVLRLNLAALTPGERPSPSVEPIPAGTPLIQPSLTPPTPSEPMRAYLRDPHRRFVHVSSFDPATGGWSQATSTDVENPASAVEAFRDARGRTVLIHNQGRRDRRTLRLSFSVDGRHFTPGCDLVPPNSQGEAAYPSVAAFGPDNWGVAFSIHGKRGIAFTRFDQAWLDACGDHG